ncbi:MAG TPA: hypothetical protein VL572_00765 [Pyrinomonadaceae bacterium]|nr:hypothetical protein [Pyrinomonadaceae bacterium]
MIVVGIRLIFNLSRFYLYNVDLPISLYDFGSLRETVCAALIETGDSAGNE